MFCVEAARTPSVVYRLVIVHQIANGESGMGNALPTIVWYIGCFDRRRENPFPVCNRTYVLDWPQLAPVEVEEVLGIVGDSPKSRHSPDGFDTTVITLTRSQRGPDWRMLKFRQHFKEVSLDELRRQVQETQSFKPVDLNAEYFEDENEQPITDYQMIQHESGQEFPIIVGGPKSVMRLGPVPPRAIEAWSATKAGTIAHFLDVVRHIFSSSWYRSPQSITFLSPSTRADGETTQTGLKLLEALFPNEEDTTAVLGYFRQLHAGDKLLASAAEIYVAHCSDSRKTWWVEERKQNFEKLVDSEPIPFQVGFTRREIIRMFMYGARLLHARSDHGDDTRLAKLIEAHGRHNAVATFNHCLYDLLAVAAQVFHVIRQDYETWISEHDLEGPGCDDIGSLFKSMTD